MWPLVTMQYCQLSKQRDLPNTQSAHFLLMTLNAAASCRNLSMTLGRPASQYRSQYLQHRSHHIVSIPNDKELMHTLSAYARTAATGYGGGSGLGYGCTGTEQSIH